MSQDQTEWSVVYKADKIQEANREMADVITEAIVYLVENDQTPAANELVKKLNDALAKQMALRFIK